MIVGIHHVAIQVADVAAARAFYVDVLGLEEIARPDFPVAGAWFKLGDQQLHIGEDANHRAPDRQHFAVRVDNLDATVAAIEAHGGDVRRAAQALPGAGLQASIRDPSGNLIELNQPD